jgi:rod shape-determining protein MreC
MAASRFAVLDPVENATLDVTSPVQATLRSVTRPTADWVNNLTDAGRLSSENQRLRTENERLTNELARAREEAAAQQQAQEVAEVRAAFPEQQFVVGSVISRDASNVRSIIGIDQGRSDGVREGMIVVSEGSSIVGTVSKTFDDYAWVTLITDPKSAVSARVQESRAEGVVSGNYGGELEMEFVGQGALVKEGDFVITSGVGGTYPPGFTIGRVGTVETREQELFQRVTVAPLAALSDLETVMVLTTFEPQDLQRP